MWIWVNSVWKLIFLKTENARSARGQKLQQPRAEDALAEPYLVQKILVIWLITADHKVLSEGCESRNDHRYAVVVQDLATQWIQSYPVKTKTSQETLRSLQKFLEPNRKPKVIYTDNSLGFGKACEDLSWNHGTSTPHRSETNGIVERAVRRVKEGTRHLCSIVAIRSGWKIVGRFHGMLHLPAKRSRSLVWWENSIWETFWETMERTDHSDWFTGWVLPYLCEGPVKNPAIWKERLTWIVPWMRFVRGGIWKGEILVADLDELETMDASEIYSKRLNAKEVIFPKVEIFPAADGRINLLGRDQELRTSTLIRERPIRGEGHVDFLGESEGSLPPPQDSFPDAGEAINDSWSMSGNFMYRHHVEPRVKHYSPREESFFIPLKYIDVSRTTHTNLDVKQEWRIDDYWNIDGSRDLSENWTGFTQSTLSEEKPPDGYLWSGERLTRQQLTSRPDHLRPELWEKLGRNVKLKVKYRRAIAKPKLDNARKLRGFFLDPDDKELKETIKNARKILETPMAPVMLCKTSKRGKHGETRGKSIEIKSKFACILEASESVRLRMEESLLNHHEDHIAGKGDGEQHTSHVTFSRWYTFNDTHMRGSSRKFGVRTSHLMRHLHALMLCVWFFSTSPLFSLCCLSSLLSSSPSSWPETCVGQIPCAHH